MSVLNRIFEAGACAAALSLPAVCAGTSVARGRPGAQEMSLCLSRRHSSFESTLKPMCSQHFWGCHLVDTELTSWPPPILKAFRWEDFLLFSPVQFWSVGQHFLPPPTMLDAQAQLVFVQWGFDSLSCHTVLPWTGLHSGMKDHDSWSPSSSSNTYYRHFYCHEGRCCHLIQAKGIDICMINFWVAPRIQRLTKASKNFFQDKVLVRAPGSPCHQVSAASHKHSGVSVPNVLGITSVRHLKHLVSLQNSNGTRQETWQRNRAGALRENYWKNTDRLNFIPLSRQVKLESEDYLANIFLSKCWCLSKSFWTGNIWEAVLLMFTSETLDTSMRYPWLLREKK